MIGFDDRFCFYERPARPMAAFSGRPALVRLLAAEGPASSSRLARQFESRSAWLLPLQWLYTHGLPLAGTPGCIETGIPG